MIDPLEISRNLVAQKASREGMACVAGERDRPVAVQRHQYRTGVGAIVRANGAVGRDGRHDLKYTKPTQAGKPFQPLVR